MLNNNEKIIIEIDPENETYKVDISFCNLARLKAVLKDMLKNIESGEFFNEPDLEIYEDLE